MLLAGPHGSGVFLNPKKESKAMSKHSGSARRGTGQAGSSGCDAVRGGEGVGGSAARPAASSYLEQDGNTVTEASCGECFEVRSVGCRSWFCPHCCLPLGLALKRRLSRELRRFR